MNISVCFLLEQQTRYEGEKRTIDTQNLSGIVIGCSSLCIPTRVYQALVAAGLSQKQLLSRHSTPSMLANVNHNLINLLPAMAYIKFITGRRGFNVCPCILPVCVRKAFTDEHRTKTFALMDG